MDRPGEDFNLDNYLDNIFQCDAAQDKNVLPKSSAEESSDLININKCLVKKDDNSINQETKEFDMFDDSFLSNHKTSENNKKPSLFEAFSKTKLINKGESEVHNGDTDTSEDEENKYCFERSNSESGKMIKNMMGEQGSTTATTVRKPNTGWKNNNQILGPTKPCTATSTNKDVYADPYFNLRIINPLISSTSLRAKMEGKTPVSFSGIDRHIRNAGKMGDWVIAGVIASKQVKTSQKGTAYSSWSLSDLKEDSKTVTVLLFGKAHQTLWKTSTHTVVAFLNPTPLDNKSNNDYAAVSVSNPDQVLVWGQSKDMGTCKARKKNGEPCNMIVNLNRCDFCVYHVKQEYRKFTARSELQSATGGSLANLRKKIIGKSGVCMGGKVVMPPTIGRPAKKQVARDQQRLSQLFNKSDSSAPESKPKTSLKPYQSVRGELIRDLSRQRVISCPAPSTSIAQRNEKTAVQCVKKTVALSTTKSKTDKESSSITKPKIEIPNKERVVPKGQLTPVRSSKPSKLVSVSNNQKKVSKDSTKPSKNRFNSLNKLVETPSCKKSKPTFDISFEFDSKSTLGSSAQIEKCLDGKENRQDCDPSVTKLGTSTEDDISTMAEKSSPGSIPKKDDVWAQYGLENVSCKTPQRRSRTSAAKARALNYIKKKGPLPKVESNDTKSTQETAGTSIDKKEEGINKRKRDPRLCENEKTDEKSDISQRFRDLMNMTSKHSSLVDIAEDNEVEDYFKKMQKKEDLENKMSTTYKVDCKAVRCIKCNYRWFSAAERCRIENHPIKVISAVKRFFQCKKCKHRTVSLEIIPLHNCKNCGEGNWVRAPMLQERSTNNVRLSIRGGEQTFTNSVETDTNLDLLVPDEGA